ncbi:autotransporter outer membrane beta-barrel domain-containing protein [Rhodovarius crocodyli]|uniref:Autotransporter outer membrane beta-barrel domain-containing protein n=1 Tax=Rhodovarius crocodyli TaxID=1979269 RepID=A0A437M3G6_9PROT|nr:autotransporter outer membrane beta-barrel domain-containing protein [Rhodovarius crocodyli]RVT92083.1 autotransporter outer membrane beta-barrel domain-containing protein [Rhodovarius crocodyli]
MSSSSSARRRRSSKKAAALALGLACLPVLAPADTISFSGGWSGTTGTQAPTIPTPANTVNTSFSAYSSAFAWNYALYSFTVTKSGTYSATVTTGPVVNTTFFLQGLFSPNSTGTPTTPISNFLYSQLISNGTGSYSGTFPSLVLTEGQTYSVLIAFNIGGTQSGDYFNFSMNGPGCAAFSGVNSCITSILAGSTALTTALGSTINPTFQGGTLRLDQTGAVYAQNFTLDTSRSNRIDQAGRTATFSGAFSDATSGGNIIIMNSGTDGRVVFSGTSTYTGSTTIESGATLAINGSLVSPVTVNADGMLRGTGSIGNSVLVASGGTIAPGNSPGTLTVAGPVVMSAGSTAQFDIDGTGTGNGAGSYSRLILTGGNGTVTLNGTVVPKLRGITGSATNSYTPGIGTAFNVISAEGGVRGSFTGLTQPVGLADGTRFDALYGTHAVDLVVTPTQYGTQALAGWAVPVGAALDRLRPAAGPAMTAAETALFAPLYRLTADRIPLALGQMSPLLYADAIAAQRDAFYAASSVIGREMQARRGPAATGRGQTAEGPRGLTLWMSGSGDFSRIGSGRDGTPGYHASSGGAVLGADTALGRARVGVAAAFGSQYVSSAGLGHYNGQAAQLMAYGSIGLRGFFLDGQFGGAFEEGRMRRSMGAHGLDARGTVTGGGWGGSVRGGRRFEANGWGIEPSLTLRGVSVSNRGVTESQAGLAGLRVGGRSLGSLQTELGVQIDRRFRINQRYAVTAVGSLGWNHEMLDTSLRASASFAALPGAGFSVRNAPTARDSAVAGVQARLETGTRLSAFAGYETRLADRYTAHSVTAGLRYSW